MVSLWSRNWGCDRASILVNGELGLHLSFIGRILSFVDCSARVANYKFIGFPFFFCHSVNLLTVGSLNSGLVLVSYSFFPHISLPVFNYFNDVVVHLLLAFF